jgi:hypothetical protein
MYKTALFGLAGNLAGLFVYLAAGLQVTARICH